MGNSKSKDSKTTMVELTAEKLDFLCESTDIKREELLIWFDKFKLKYPNGKLSKEEFVNVYKKCFPKSRSNKFSDYVFQVVDKDHDGYIDFDEFVLIASVNSDKDISKRLHLFFKVYDLDKNGKIDSLEMAKVLRALFALKGQRKSEILGENLIEKLIKNIFQKFDNDKDGYLTEDEFVRGFMDNEHLISLVLPVSEN